MREDNQFRKNGLFQSLQMSLPRGVSAYVALLPHLIAENSELLGKKVSTSLDSLNRLGFLHIDGLQEAS